MSKNPIGGGSERGNLDAVAVLWKLRARNRVCASVRYTRRNEIYNSESSRSRNRRVIDKRSSDVTGVYCFRLETAAFTCFKSQIHSRKRFDILVFYHVERFEKQRHIFKIVDILLFTSKTVDVI